MKLDNVFSLEKSGDGVALVELVNGYKVDKKNGVKIPDKKEKRYYYGCLYQALQGYIQQTADNNMEMVAEYVTMAMRCIDSAKDAIKEEFCIEVKVR